VAVVEEKEVVVVVVSFAFIPSSLFSFVLHFVAFSSSSCCGGSGADVEVVVVVADVVLVVVVVVCSFPLLASSSSSLCGCAGSVDDPAEEDVDFEVELDAVDVVSLALAVVSLGFKALVSDSILAAMALRQDVGVDSF
jgi:hypothetical protein